MADAQGLLFEGDFSPIPADLGFRGPIACNAAGITYRQLDYWARTGLVVPEVRGASGSGSQRLYSFRDILMLKVIKRLIDAGISLQQIRTAIEHLRARGVEDLTEVTLMSDGVSVFECTSDDEVIDLLRGGQGVFGIALGGVWRDIEGTLLRPAGRAGRDPEPRRPPPRPRPRDELTQRPAPAPRGGLSAPAGRGRVVRCQDLQRRREHLGLDTGSTFAARHIGPRPDERDTMLAVRSVPPISTTWSAQPLPARRSG